MGEHYVPFGVARIARPGRDITIVAAGQMVPRALEAAEALAGEGIEAEVIDLRTIMPLDVETIVASVAQDPPPAGGRRGLGDVRHRRRDRPDDQRARVRRARRAGRAAAPGADLASVRAGAGAGDAGRHRADRRGRAAGARRHRAGAGSLARAGPAGGAPLPGAAPRPRATSARSAQPGAPAAGEMEITMPFGDLTVSEGRVVAWLKAVGDRVARASSSPRSRPTRRWSRSRRPPPARSPPSSSRSGRGADGRPHRADPAGERMRRSVASAPRAARRSEPRSAWRRRCVQRRTPSRAEGPLDRQPGGRRWRRPAIGKGLEYSPVGSELPKECASSHLASARA